MNSRKRPPAIAYGKGDGLLDPRKLTLQDRTRKGPDRFAAEKRDAATLSRRSSGSARSPDEHSVVTADDLG